MITEEDLAGCDPGIRELVRLLNQNGFETSDSGDGVSKPEMGCAESTPNVYMVVPPSAMLVYARTLYDFIKARIGAPETSDTGPDWQVQASYDPDDESAIVSLHGVDDARLGTSL